MIMFSGAGMTRHLCGDDPLDAARVDCHAAEVADFVIGGMLKR